MSLINMGKVPKPEVTYVKMLLSSQKSGLQPALNASFANLPLLPPCDDIILFKHGYV